MNVASEKTKAPKVSAKFTGPNHVQLVRGGKPYFDLLLKLINNAREIIHLQTYIFDDDETGGEVAEALMAAARRNVAVFVLVDGYASRGLGKEFIRRIRESGVCFRFFEPLFKSTNFYFGRRMHHKILVTDAQHSLIGGINISNRYNDVGGQPAWLDFGLYSYGKVAREFCLLCAKMWRGFKTSIRVPSCPPFRAAEGMSVHEESLVRIRLNDWVRGKHQIAATYLRMLRTASSQLIIMSSYFLPGERFKRSLRRAVKRGVKIKVVVAGYSDVLIAKNAEKYMYDWLLRHNIEIYEVKDRVLHAKIATCDGKWMTVGSFNVNDISAHASIEANVDVSDPEFVRSTEQVLLDIIKNECQLITVNRHTRTKNILRQFYRWLSYQTVRLILFLFTFYFKPKMKG
ncbi:MAG TPA: phospholipase D-like domain-containing protein [Chitinophagaceae bacterium]|nr:phospholipase D-like domain-containing protein [Chitinophagaceae bacterium]